MRYFKEDKEGMATMCKAMDELCNMAAREQAIQIARMMVINGEPDDKIVRYTGLTLDEIKAIDARQPA